MLYFILMIDHVVIWVWWHWMTAECECWLPRIVSFVFVFLSDAILFYLVLVWISLLKDLVVWFQGILNWCISWLYYLLDCFKDWSNLSMPWWTNYMRLALKVLDKLEGLSAYHFSCACVIFWSLSIPTYRTPSIY